MKTLRILAMGWLLGGLAIVLLWTAAMPVAALDKPAPAGAVRTVRAPEILIPVVGVEAKDIKDTFAQARGATRTHRALDILAPRGTPVVAAVDGTIRKLFNSRAGGITIYQFDRTETRVFYYAHLDRYADNLREGDFVKQGTVIGYVGTTGNAPATTPHLHFSIENLPPTKEWWKGEPVNPYPLLQGGAVGSGQSAAGSK